MESTENIKKIIFDFIKTIDTSLSQKSIKELLNSFLDENSFNIERSLLLNLIENNEFISNLKLLYEVEEYLKGFFDDIFIENSKIIDITGVVSYIELEIGFWAIKSHEENWNPINFPKELMKDGLELRFKLELLPDMLTASMWGKSVKILNYNKISK